MEADKKTSLKELEDYYMEDGLMVFTAYYHLKRGFCCQNSCRHCPFAFNKSKPMQKKNHQ